MPLLEVHQEDDDTIVFRSIKDPSDEAYIKSDLTVDIADLQ